MSVSKVIKFFEQRNIYFTKTMLQNYVRVGVLPELLNKRYYQKKHLVFLVLIDSLKSIFSLNELKELFAPFLSNGGDESGDSDFDYKLMVTVFNNVYNQTIMDEAEELQELRNTLDGSTKDFFCSLNLMSKCLALKDLSIKSLDEAE